MFLELQVRREIGLIWELFVPKESCEGVNALSNPTHTLQPAGGSKCWQVMGCACLKAPFVQLKDGPAFRDDALPDLVLNDTDGEWVSFYLCPCLERIKCWRTAAHPPLPHLWKPCPLNQSLRTAALKSQAQSQQNCPLTSYIQQVITWNPTSTSLVGAPNASGS